MGRKKRQRKKANKKEKLETMAQAAGAYSSMRPHEQEARNRIMHQQLSMMQPLNNIMGMMYGQGNTMGGGHLGGIISEEMMGVGRTSKDPGMMTQEDLMRAENSGEMRTRGHGAVSPGGGSGGARGLGSKLKRGASRSKGFTKKKMPKSGPSPDVPNRMQGVKKPARGSISGGQRTSGGQMDPKDLQASINKAMMGLG